MYEAYKANLHIAVDVTRFYVDTVCSSSDITSLLHPDAPFVSHFQFKCKYTHTYDSGAPYRIGLLWKTKGLVR